MKQFDIQDSPARCSAPHSHQRHPPRSGHQHGVLHPPQPHPSPAQLPRLPVHLLLCPRSPLWNAESYELYW